MYKGQTGSKTTLGQYNISNYIMQQTKANGGCTINTQYEIPTRGYMVAIKGFNTLEEMMDYKLKPNEYYGTWVDNGKVYYDVSVNIPTEKQAIILATFRHELAIWDVENNQSILMNILNWR